LRVVTPLALKWSAMACGAANMHHTSAGDPKETLSPPITSEVKILETVSGANMV
jgi:hypothetical protein